LEEMRIFNRKPWITLLGIRLDKVIANAAWRYPSSRGRNTAAWGELTLKTHMVNMSVSVRRLRH
jgi:hypothetical protein